VQALPKAMRHEAADVHPSPSRSARCSDSLMRPQEKQVDQGNESMATSRELFGPRLSLVGPSRPIVLATLAMAAVIFVWPSLVHAIDVWTTAEEFSFAFLVGPVVGAMIWWRRDELVRSVTPGTNAGLGIALVALATYLVARRVDVLALAGIAVCPLLWGIVVYMWGWQAGRVLAFPVGFLAFGLGLYRGLLNSVGFALQGITASGASAFAQMLGVQVAQDGLVLHSNGFAIIVAEACSGMSSLLALLALSTLLTYVTRGSFAARMIVVAGVVPIVLVANVTRVTSVLLVAMWFGQDAATGFFHGASSLFVFGLSLGGLLLLNRIVGCKIPSIVL
jgi:exosortase